MKSSRSRLHAFFHSDTGRKSLLLLAIVAWLLHHHFVFLGFYNNDDINYARLAHQWLTGEAALFQPGNHLALRWTPIGVTAFFYWLFGINEVTTSAYGLLTLSGTGWIIYTLLRKQPLLVYLLSLLLFFGNYSVLFYTHRLLPDSGICLLIFAAWYACYRYRFGHSASRWYWPVLFAGANALALLTKETIIMALPLYIIYMLGDVRNRAGRKFWIICLPVMAVLLFVYLLVFKVYTDDWFYRFHMLQNGQYLNDCRYDLLPVVETIKRVGYYLWYNFLRNGDMIYLSTAATAYFYRKQLRLSTCDTHIVTACMILLLTSDLMTISLTRYVPLCEDPRHFLFLMPFAAVSGSYLLRGYLATPKDFIALPVVFLLMTAILYITGGGEIKIVYALLTALLFAWLFMGGKGRAAIGRLYVVVAVACIMTILPFHDIYSKKQAFYFDHKNMITSVFPQRISTGIVLTGDDLTAELSEYFMRFETGNIRFQNLKRFNPSPGEDVYLLVNGAPSAYVNESFARAAAEYDNHGLEKIVQEGTLILYRVRNNNSLAALKRFAIY